MNTKYFIVVGFMLAVLTSFASQAGEPLRVVIVDPEKEYKAIFTSEKKHYIRFQFGRLLSAKAIEQQASSYKDPKVKEAFQSFMHLLAVCQFGLSYDAMHVAYPDVIVSGLPLPVIKQATDEAGDVLSTMTAEAVNTMQAGGDIKTTKVGKFCKPHWDLVGIDL